MDYLSLDPLLRAALQEDLGHGDLTTDAIAASCGSKAGLAGNLAHIEAREEFVLAGWCVFRRVFQLLGRVEDEVHFREGMKVKPTTIGILRADPVLLLKGERVALNFLQRLCGIATVTRKYVDLIAHTRAKVLDTRKTTPLWRGLEKYAVRMGGGHNHRHGLDDGILIKDNHIVMAGGVKAAIEACRHRRGHLQKIEVEVTNLKELEQAISTEVEIVLLDNMTADEVREAMRLAKGRCLVEVSGGVNENNIVQYAEAGVDFISLGALTHSYRASDVRMLLQSDA